MITNTYTYLLRFWLARTGQNPQLRARQNNAQPVRKQNTAGQAAIPSRRYGCLPAHLCAARADWYGVIHGIKDRQVGNKTPGVTNPQLALGPNRQAHCVRCVVSLFVILFASPANNARAIIGPLAPPSQQLAGPVEPGTGCLDPSGQGRRISD